MDIIEYQLQEINEADPQPGEWKKLNKKLNKLNNLEKIHEITGGASDVISGDDFQESSMLNKLGKIKDDLISLTDYDEELADMAKMAGEIFSSLQDLGFRLRNYYEEQNYNQAETRKIRQRLDLLNNLRSKYGENIEEILAFRDEILKEKEELSSLEDRLSEVEKEHQKLYKKCQEIADKLTEHRQEVAKWLEEKLIEELAQLAMKEASFEVKFSSKENLSPSGQDQVEFLISPNPGLELKKLTRIASGGEISRIMLAFKSIIAGFDKVQTLIFDEVDAGVGGETAQQMANRLFKISTRRQVICITHLPQIASMADRHFYIEKITTDKNKVTTKINKLTEKKRQQEIARMVEGERKSAAGLKHADEMLARAEKIKLNI